MQRVNLVVVLMTNVPRIVSENRVILMASAQRVNLVVLIKSVTKFVLENRIVFYCIKTLFKDTSPVNGALISTGGVYNVKNYKRYKEKEDYLQIGVTPDVMVKRSYNLFQIYIVLELSFKWLLNRCIDSASFVSIERLFHSLAPLYLKLFFRNSLLGLGRAKSV